MSASQRTLKDRLWRGATYRSRSRFALRCINAVRSVRTMSSPGRRHFLSQASAAALALAAIPRSASAQPQPQGAAALKVVDFHNHYVGPHFAAVAGAGAPAAQQAYWQAVNRNLADPDALLASIETAGISARVINTPLEFLRNAGGELAPDTVSRINEGLAELVAKHPGRLYGLATVDAYTGEAAASELIRAVRELGLRGVFVEAAKGELFLDAPQARPVLAAAAALGVPVFCHPITDPALLRRFRGLGRLGVTLNRGTINTAALFALLESGTFEEVPNLRLVVTTLALGGMLMAGGFGDGQRLRRDTPAALRRHVYVDTMGLNPVLIRSAVDLLGPNHVLAGTDWPVFTESDIPGRLAAALTECGLDAAGQQQIANGNALKLLAGT
jgi:predicted TIM-barrel fold metal-dependent hydrolase